MPKNSQTPIVRIYCGNVNHPENISLTQKIDASLAVEGRGLPTRWLR